MQQLLTKIPYVNLSEQHQEIKDELMSAVRGVLDSGKFVLGEEVNEFEASFAKLCGVEFALGVNSGTDAITLGLRALEIGEGDEVITVANSFISAVSAIRLVGATPVFVDVDETFNLNPDLLEEAITEKTKAIMPVHLTGMPAKMDIICNIAKKHKLFIVEDCAQAVTAEYKGQRVGSFGDIGCFSLHPLKTLNACGDGGVITTNNQELNEKMALLRNNGFKNRSECVVWSDNSRLDSMQAAMLLVKLKYLDQWTEQRRINAAYYKEKLSDVSQVQVPIEPDNARGVYHTFVIQAENRDQLKEFLAEQGVGSKIHYEVPIHLQPAAAELNYKESSLPQTEAQSKKILSLPIYQQLETTQIDYVCDCIREFYKGKEV